MANRSESHSPDAHKLFREPRVITCTPPLPKLHSAICVSCHYLIWELLGQLFLRLQSLWCYLIWKPRGLTQAASVSQVSIAHAIECVTSVCHDVFCGVLWSASSIVTQSTPTVLLPHMCLWCCHQSCMYQICNFHVIAKSAPLCHHLIYQPLVDTCSVHLFPSMSSQLQTLTVYEVSNSFCIYSINKVLQKIFCALVYSTKKQTDKIKTLFKHCNKIKILQSMTQSLASKLFTEHCF